MTNFNKWLLLLISVLLSLNVIIYIGWYQIEPNYEWYLNTPIRKEKCNYIILETLTNQTVYGYSSTIDQTDNNPFTTASGMKVKEGIIANNCHSFGTKVLINDKIYEVQDRMNDRYGCNTWDIWFTTRHDAVIWGNKITQVSVLDE